MKLVFRNLIGNNGFLSPCAFFPSVLTVFDIYRLYRNRRWTFKILIRFIIIIMNLIIIIVMYVYCFIAKVFSNMSFCLKPHHLISKASMVYYLLIPHFISKKTEALVKQGFTGTWSHDLNTNLLSLIVMCFQYACCLLKHF